MLWVPLPKAVHLPVSGLKSWEQLRAAVSLSCLSAVLGRLCLLHTLQILPGFGTYSVSDCDCTSCVTSSQLYASGGWVVPIINVNT